jgi:hypothetical protein
MRGNLIEIAENANARLFHHAALQRKEARRDYRRASNFF